MANYLASIFGTEQDKVNCSFYYKIGACRHGDRCSRKHVKPSYSQTVLMPNLYQNPAYDNKSRMNPAQPPTTGFRAWCTVSVTAGASPSATQAEAREEV